MFVAALHGRAGYLSLVKRSSLTFVLSSFTSLTLFIHGLYVASRDTVLSVSLATNSVKKVYFRIYES